MSIVAEAPGVEKPDITVIALGWGVQSFGLAAFSAVGLLPKVDAAVFTDGGNDCTATYEFAERWQPWLEERGVNVVRIPIKNPSPLQQRKDSMSCHIPAFMARRSDGTLAGLLGRQCTAMWKVAPVNRWIRKQFGDGLPRAHVWLGITSDEDERAVPSRAKYITNVFPFLDFYEYPMSRMDVISRLRFLGIEVPPRSACYFCPMRPEQGWLEMKKNYPHDFERACEIDEQIRDFHPNVRAYIWRELRPLSEIGEKSELCR